MALAIIMVTSSLAKSNINQTVSDYSYASANADALSDLNDSLTSLDVSFGLNATLAVFMVGGFIFNAVTLGKPLRSYQASEVHEQ